MSNRKYYKHVYLTKYSSSLLNISQELIRSDYLTTLENSDGSMKH